MNLLSFHAIISASIEKSYVLTCSRIAILYNFIFFSVYISIAIIVLHDWNNFVCLFLFSVVFSSAACVFARLFIMFYLYERKKAKLQVWHTNYRWILYYRIRVNWIWIELMTLITHLLFSASHTQCWTNIKRLNISSFQVERKHSLLLKRLWYGWWLLFLFFPETEWSGAKKKSCLIKMLLVDGVRAVNLRRKGERRSRRETYPVKCI